MKPKPVMPEREQNKHRHLIRTLPFLLLTLYTTISILKLPPPPPPPTSLQLHPSPINTDVDSALKTHISSNAHHLQAAHEETTGTTSIPCSSLMNGGSINSSFICCDRSNYRTDLCYLKGDIRTSPGSNTILLHNSGPAAPERIRPYTRKWETGVMDTIDELTLRVASGNEREKCDVRHDGVPAVVFSAGGYTGNVYHEFNDGLIPLFITTEMYEGEVVLVVLEYHSWWYNKYRSVIKKMTKHKVVDLAGDSRVHCFGEAVVGLSIHGELAVDPKLMPNGKGIRDFQSLLAQGLTIHPPPATAAVQTYDRPSSGGSANPSPTITIFIRHKSRVLYNLKDIIRACQRIGFNVQTLDPKRTTPLSEIYSALSSSDAMLAVHGAALTHFLFMRPPAAMIQIVPIGLDWAAETYYGEPARKLGLDYVAYRVAPEESSLLRVYGRKDPVIVDPKAITSKGWSETKVYLDRQNVRVNIKRLSRVLERVHGRIRSRMHAKVKG